MLCMSGIRVDDKVQILGESRKIQKIYLTFFQILWPSQNMKTVIKKSSKF